jgi:protein-export membrane protein SecD
MKRCPTCSRVYDDVSLRFCFDDGAELVNKVPCAGAPETAIMPGPARAEPAIPAPPPQANATTPPTGPTTAIRKKSMLPWAIGAGALLLVLGVGAVAAIILLRPKPPLVHHLVLQFASESKNPDATAVQAAAVIKNRLNALGVSRFEVKPGNPGSGQILVDLPVLENPERVKRVISTWGKLEFVHIISPGSPAPTRTFATEQEAVAAMSDGTIHGRVLPYQGEAQPASNQPPRNWVIAEVPAIVDGLDLRNASAVRSPGGGGSYEIQFFLKQDGANKFGTWTASHINDYIGIVLNDEVKSIAFIKSQISDSGVITGRYAKESAEDLALVLNAGALPMPVQFVEERIDQH